MAFAQVPKEIGHKRGVIARTEARASAAGRFLKAIENQIVESRETRSEAWPAFQSYPDPQQPSRRTALDRVFERLTTVQDLVIVHPHGIPSPQARAQDKFRPLCNIFKHV